VLQLSFWPQCAVGFTFFFVCWRGMHTPYIIVSSQATRVRVDWTQHARICRLLLCYELNSQVTSSCPLVLSLAPCIAAGWPTSNIPTSALRNQSPPSSRQSARHPGNAAHSLFWKPMHNLHALATTCVATSSESWQFRNSRSQLRPFGRHKESPNATTRQHRPLLLPTSSQAEAQ
jgi:hypothetical protein